MPSNYITSKEIVNYWMAKKAASPRVYLWSDLFPVKKQMTNGIEWIVGANKVTPILMPSEFDANTIPLPIEGFSARFEKLPLFKNRVQLSEENMVNLGMAETTSMESMRNEALSKIYDSFIDLLDASEMVPDYLAINQLLSNGTIAFSANGVNKNLDYGLDASQKETLAGTDKWSDLTNSTPVTDIIGWCDTIEAYSGTRPTYAIVSRTVFNYMKNNVGINAVVAASGLLISDDLLRTYMEQQTGVSFIIYSKQYKGYDGTSHPIYPTTKITLLPSGTIGNMIYGATPEEIQLYSNKNLDVTIVDPAVSVNVYKGDDIVTTNVKVSEMVLPSGENLNKIFIGTVA